MKSRSHHNRLPNSEPPDDWVNGSWTVDCVCGVNFDDGEEMVNCDECGVWVHTRCSRYVKGDDVFACDKCKMKNNRNDSEETEVAQLLVELPTKSVRIESSYAGAHRASRRPPFRLWTEIPIEERVHVQGKPGGDSAMFSGLSSVFTPELWKCTGYVPKKFNFRYREFPSWDDTEGDGKLDEVNENPVDKGAGVLFSLSKERLVSAPEEAASDQRKVCLKESNKWDSDGLDLRRSEKGSKQENGLLRSVMLHVGKRKKEDYSISKDRSGIKKARGSGKDSDAKKRGTHSFKTVFTPTSDAKHLAFYEDRAQKFHKDEVQSTKNKRPRETEVYEPTSDSHLEVTDKAKNHFKETSSAAIAAPECSPETKTAVCSVGNRDTAGKLHVKEEEVGMPFSKTDGCFEVSVKTVGNCITKDVPGVVEAKQNKILDSNSDLTMKSKHPATEVKVEDLVNSSGSLLNVQYSLRRDAEDPGVSSDQMSEIPKVNGVISTTSQPPNHKAEDFDQSSEAASDSHMNKAGPLVDDLCLLRSELEGTEGLMALHKSPRARKPGTAFLEEHAKPGETVLSLHALSGQRKMVACMGKPSTSTTILTPKSSTFEQFKSVNTCNPFAKSQNMHDSNVNVRKDRAQDVFRDENPRRIVKERPKSVGNSISKPLNLSRITHDSLSRKCASETKEIFLFASSKSSSTSNVTIPSGSCEPGAQLHHQKATPNVNNKSSASGLLSQKCEKPSQPNFQPSAKINQNHVPSVCPPIPSSSPAALSDEELALLLHQELNSSPRVPRVPRMRNVGTSPQLPSTSTSLLMKRISSSGGKDHSVIPKRKFRDAAKDGFHCSREGADEPRRMERVFPSHDPKRRDTDYTTEATGKEDGESAAMESGKRNAPPTLDSTNSDPSSSNEANNCNLVSIRSSPQNVSDDDAGTVGGPVRQTLPALINDIMGKGNRMTYEELCNAVLPHWQNLRKHNGERYAYTSHSQAVLDCLRNRHEWASLVDRGPKTNSSRKRRKQDAEDLEDNDYGKGKGGNQVESKGLESQREDFPKGKRKARKRRRLALQGKGIQDIRKRRKRDRLPDEDFGTSSNSSEASSACSEDEHQGGGGSEASSSSREEGSL